MYAYLNGVNDSSGLVAAAISSRSISLHRAFILASIAEFAGPFLFGTAVATTIGKGLVDTQAITLTILLNAIVSAVFWNSAAAFLGLPTSSTHALIGGLIGAVVSQDTWHALHLNAFVQVLFAMFLSPLIGLIVGFLATELVLHLARNSTPHINEFFKRAQMLNVIALALSHGTNDGQKSMGLIALALAVYQQSSFQVPIWVTLLCAIALTLGVNQASHRTMKTVGRGIYRMRPVHAFVAQTASASIVWFAALTGAPISTTQVVSAAIMGVGSAERVNGVRWHVALRIMLGWLITIPASALVAVVLGRVIEWICALPL